MNRRDLARSAGIGILLIALGGALWSVRGEPTPPTSGAALSPATLLAKQASPGFARAEAPRAFRFPEDHGPHPTYQNEWWYFTGVLAGKDGRLFGYELTFFRFALPPEQDAGRSSAWSTSQVYMAHFSITDAGGGSFVAFEKVAREAVGLAGAVAVPFHVWVLDWSAEGPDRSDVVTPLRLRARNGDVAIDLELEQGKAPVLQGEGGLSRKGKALGNASYYYSLTRMPTRGTVVSRGETFEARGDSWMDREWSTSALEPDQVGWDWLGLALSDGRELMMYRLRRRDGSSDAPSSGTIVEPDGQVRRLDAGDVRMTVLSTWQSERTKATYPSSLRLEVPSARLDLVLTPLLQDQEVVLSFHYWEGAVSARSDNGPSGRGYLELTGYDGAALGAR